MGIEGAELPETSATVGTQLQWSGCSAAMLLLHVSPGTSSVRTAWAPNAAARGRAEFTQDMPRAEIIWEINFSQGHLVMINIDALLISSVAGPL